MKAEPFQALIAQRVTSAAVAVSLTEPRQTWQSCRAPGVPLAIASSALGGDLFGEPMALSLVDSVAVISITGALSTRASMWGGASYAEIRHAVAMAVDSPEVRGIVLDIDSPGGDVSGNFDMAREIRTMAQAASKPLIGFASGDATSAAYSILSAADEVIASDSAVTGSIGVITTVPDESAALEMMGIKVSIITSGDRKGDGHPAEPLSDESRIAVQSKVNSLAQRFFGLVAEHRGGEASTYEALQASQFVGGDAIAAGLVDRVGTLHDAIETASGRIASMPDRDEDESKAKATDDDEMRAALVSATEDEDDGKAAKATRALAAYDAEDEDEDEEAKAKAKAKAEDDEEDEEAKATAKAKAKEDDEDEKAKAAATTKSLATTVAKQAAQLAAMERREFFATRPDLPTELVKSLAETPLGQIKKIVASIPKTIGKAGPAEPENLATRGGTGIGHTPGPVNSLSAQMGLTQTQRVIKSEGNTLQLGVTVAREN